MKKVLLYYHFSCTRGGGDFLPLSLLEELHRISDVTLAVDVESGFEAAAELFGFHFDRSRFRVVPVMPPGYSMAKHNFWHSRYRCRQLKKLAAGADVCIAANNIMDFGRPAHHFINVIDIGDDDFLDYVHHRRPSTGTKLRRYLQNRILKPLSGMRTKRAAFSDPREHIYPNSEFMNRLLRGFYPPFNGSVFFPPTAFEPGPVSVPRDPLKIVYLGRITAGKRLPDIIGIVERVRAATGLDLKLSIAGPLKGAKPEGKLGELVEGKDWIDFPGALYGDAKTRFLFSGTYAVHAMRDEAFGISITEYMKAGLIPIVPDEGGACEVADDPELSFHTDDQAAAILARLLNDPDFRERKRRKCADRAAVFSYDAYLARQHALIKSILDA